MSKIDHYAECPKGIDKWQKNSEILLIRNHELTALHQQMVDLLAEKGVITQEDFNRLIRK